MPTRKDLPLEEKLKIPVFKLPFSRAVKNELYYKGVRTFDQIVEKYNRYPGRVSLAGFTDKVYSETANLFIAMGLDEKNEHYKYTLQEDDSNWKLRPCSLISKRRKEKILDYTNKKV